MNQMFNWFGWKISGWGILQVILFILLFIIGINSCDYQNSRLLSEQAITFEEELSFRQKKEIELENKIKKQQEELRKLEQELECRKEEK